MRVTALAVAALALAVSTGCASRPQHQDGSAAPAGSPGPSAPASAAPSGTPTASAPATSGAPTTSTGDTTPARCQISQITADIEQFERPGQSGASQSARVKFTNTGNSCTMSGYIGLQLLANGQPRETRLVHAGGPPQTVTLHKGGVAWALIDWMFTPDPDETDTDPICAPRPTGALVAPPGASGSIRVAEDFGTLCRHGQVYTSPVSTTRPV
jgi:hypothetical protein